MIQSRALEINLARTQVEVPTHLNAAQRAKLMEFAELCDDKVNPQSQGFLEKAKAFFRSV